jgi:predicted nuclease with TOPRIM domain
MPKQFTCNTCQDKLERLADENHALQANVAYWEDRFKEADLAFQSQQRETARLANELQILRRKLRGLEQ